MGKYEIVVGLITTFLCILLTESDSAKILAVLPLPSISHQVVFRPLMQELAKKGHKVTVLTPDPAFPEGQAPQNLTEIDLHNLSYATAKKTIETAMSIDQNDIMALMKHFAQATIDIFKSQFQSEGVQAVLKKNKEFDLVIVEDAARPALIFGDIYKAPVIQISSLGILTYNNDAFGIPSHPILYPHALSKRNYKLTVWEKVTEVFTFFFLKWYFEGPEVELEDAMLREVFGSNVPSVREMNKHVDMLFVNSHSMWESNVPVPPGVVRIWGIHKTEKKELPTELDTYLNESKHGVIYISFGTNAIPSKLPSDKIQAFIKAFSKLPYNVLWKWDADELPGRTDNIRIQKWLPQADLLRHPNIKLFITQGGIQSTEESINAGVPLIGVPLMHDQFFNVDKYQSLRIGLKLDIEKLTEDDVSDAIKTVLKDESYRINVVNLRNIMRDEPQTALERAVWWTEYVLRHKGAKHLRAAGANLSWIEYYEIPLVSFILFSLLIATVGVLTFLRLVFMTVFTSKQKVKKH